MLCKSKRIDRSKNVKKDDNGLIKYGVRPEDLPNKTMSIAELNKWLGIKKKKIKRKFKKKK